MEPSTILSYYPTYNILDEILFNNGSNKYKKFNIFIDLKNNLQTLYMKHAVENILESTKKSQFIDTSIFSSLISFLAFHKMYAIKRDIEINFFIFFETGQSYYHKNLSKKYKISRRIDDLYGLDKESRDLFYNIIQKNLMLIEKACNKMPNIKVIRLENLEADFIPYYLIRNKYVDNNNDVANITYSNDHDLMQNIKEHSYQFQKTPKGKKIIKQHQVMNSFLKKETNFKDEYLAFSMAILGDPGDDVIGIKGIGPSRLIDILDELITLVGGIENLYENVINNKPIFKNENLNNSNKYINKIIESEINNKVISTNLKLVSFELLSRVIDSPHNTEILKKRELIESVIMDNTISSKESIQKALDMNRVFLESNSLDIVYYKPEGLIL